MDARMRRPATSETTRPSGWLRIVALVLVVCVIYYFRYGRNSSPSTPVQSTDQEIIVTGDPEEPAQILTKDSMKKEQNKDAETGLDSADPVNIEDVEFSVGPQEDMHAVKGGKANGNVMLLVHGGSSLQDASHWSPHFNFFSQFGTFYAVDLLGHGTSSKTSAGIPRQVEALIKVLDEVMDPNKRLVIIGRSYGGGIVLSLLKKLAQHRPAIFSKVAGIVLIAPAVSEAQVSGLPVELTALPLELVWSKDDQTVLWETSAWVRKAFPNTKMVLFDEVLKTWAKEHPGASEDETWRAHQPENARVKEFQEETEIFLASILNVAKN